MEFNISMSDGKFRIIDLARRSGDTMEKDLKEVERSIIKTYRKALWARFVKGIIEYSLIDDGDKIAVAISGGKDSLLMAKLFQELQRINVVKFDLEFIAMNPGFSKENLKGLLDNCKKLGINVKVFESDIFNVTDKIAREQPCYLCARMRRGFLYKTAQELGCNKLALGHHFDDVIETTLLNLLYAGNFKTMVPKIKSANFEGMTLIRPMYLIKEEDIKRFMNNAGITTMNCGCGVAAGKISSKREEIKNFIASMRKIHKDVDASIFKSAENINLGAVLGYYKGSKKTNFKEIFEEE